MLNRASEKRGIAWNLLAIAVRVEVVMDFGAGLVRPVLDEHLSQAVFVRRRRLGMGAGLAGLQIVAFTAP
jgi:hypothetical protein